MSALVVACPGDPYVPNAHMVFLLDARPYPPSLFQPYFDTVAPGPGVECIENEGQVWFQLTEEGLARLDQLRRDYLRVLFFTSSDTHVKSFTPIAKRCDHSVFVVRATDDHSARAALEKEGLPCREHAKSMPEWKQVDVALTGNDWGLEDRLFTVWARRKNIPSICLQESIIDFDDDTCKMQWADFAMIQGAYTFRYLKRRFSFLVGNPRYDAIERLPLPQHPKVFINCNFTFGIHEEHGRAWVDDVVDTAKLLDLDYVVSVHPRCRTNLIGIENIAPSNAFVVHEQMQASTIVVTRFSSLAHEALLMGRHVIYYNPHRETMRFLNEDSTGLLMKAANRDELRAALATAISTPSPVENPELADEAFSSLFCGADRRSHERCALALRAIVRYGKLYRNGDYQSEPALAIQARLYYQNRLRPRLYRIAPLRWAWRIAKRVLLTTSSADK